MLLLAGFCIVAPVLFHANFKNGNELANFTKDLAIGRLPRSHRFERKRESEYYCRAQSVARKTDEAATRGQILIFARAGRKCSLQNSRSDPLD